METNRIFKDLDLVEQLGAGIPRVLQTYDKECYKFSDNYMRMSYPRGTATKQVTEQIIKYFSILEPEMSIKS